MMLFEVDQFRSIKMQRVELAPITVLYGPNGSGKSSLLYALLVMKNVLLNMESQSGDFFNLGFVNLGDRRSVIHDHNVKEVIYLETETTSFGCRVMYRMQFARGRGVSIDIQVLDGDSSVSAHVEYRSPFTSFESQQEKVTFKGSDLMIAWEGTRGHVVVDSSSQDSREDVNNARLLETIINEPMEFVREMCIAPLQMAFSRGELTFTTTDFSLNSTLFFSEDQVGTLLATRNFLQTPVSHYLEDITNRTLRVFSPPGDLNYSIHVADQNTGLETELVNDGYGVNRAAWLLALALHDETKWMCIEEPETHLHPTSIRQLVKTFVNVMHNEDKRFLFTTHSEVFALATLSEVARGNLKPDEVAFYLTRKEGKETKFERQEINKHGQIEGGLTSFMEGELEDLAVLFGETN